MATRPLNRAYTLSSFVEGDSNRMATAAARAVVDHCGAPAHNPLVFYGGVGLGKTHLMQAVGNALLQKNRRTRVVYFSSEDFVNRLISAIRLQAMDVFRAHYRDEVDVLLIDDVQFFADKDASEAEAFNTIDTLSETGRQIVITCDRYPGDLGAMEARLRSRIGRGLSVPIEVPDLETRAAILMSKALQAREPLSEEVALFIARHVASNVRELEGALNKVIASAHFARRPIDMDMARRALAHVIASSNRGPTIQDIKKRVADYYRVRVSELDSPSRKASHVRPRQMAMYLARHLTRHSLPEIGEQFGGRDHTTVLHACNRMNQLRAVDAECENDYSRLHRELSE